MKRLIAILALLTVLVGGAGAGWYSETETGVDATYSGTVKAEHFNSTDDAEVLDDLEVGGDLTVTGSASIGGGYIASGVVVDDLAMAAGKDLDCASGASEFDWSKGSGITKTTSGINTIGGGTNEIILNGPVTGATAKSWTMAGASTLTIGSTGLQAVLDTIYLLDAVSGTSGAFSGALTAATLVTTGIITSGGVITGEGLLITDDAQIEDNLGVLGTFTCTETVQAEQLTSTDCADIVADLTAGTIASDSWITAVTSITAADGEFSDDVNVTDDLIVGGDVVISGTLSGDPITAIEANMTALRTDVDANTTRIGTLEGNDTTHDGLISGLRTDVDANETRLGIVEDAYISEVVLTWPINAASVDENIFTASDAWVVTHIEEVHAVAGNDASAVTVFLMVCDGTEAPSAGVAAQSAAFDLKGTANTVQAGSLSGTPTLADGDRLALDYTGTLTTLAGGSVTVHLARA